MRRERDGKRKGDSNTATAEFVGCVGLGETKGIELRYPAPQVWTTISSRSEPRGEGIGLPRELNNGKNR